MAHHLGKAGYTSEILTAGTDVLARVRQDPPELVVLDLMLPGLSGLEICRAMRADPGPAVSLGSGLPHGGGHLRWPDRVPLSDANHELA